MAYVFSFLFSMLIEEKAIIVATVMFIFVDLLTGLWKALKLKEKITSKALRRTIEKLISYLLVIMLAKILDKTIINIEAISLHTIVAGLIFLVEFKSVTENMGIITGNKIFSEIYSTVSQIIKRKPNDRN